MAKDYGRHYPLTTVIRPVLRRLWPIAGLSLLLFLLGVSPWGLWERDEGRYADVASEMLARGDFVTPHVDGTIFLDKPPLVYWVTAGSLAIWGHSEFGARFGQLLFALGTLLVTWRAGILLLGRQGGSLAVIVLASSALFFASSHILTLDLALTFFVSLTLFLFLKGRQGGKAGTAAYAGMFAAAAGGVLTKGLLGAVLPALTIVCFLSARREWRVARHIPWVRGSLLFLLLAAPWYVAVSIANPEFPVYFFLHEHLARFTTAVHRHQGGWWYYLPVLAAALMPWSLMLPACLRRRRTDGGGAAPAIAPEAPAFLWSWIIPGLLLFTVAQSKLPLYVLPLVPPLALLIASSLESHLEQERHLRLFLWPTVLLIVLAAGAAVIERRREGWVFLDEAWTGKVVGVAVASLALGALLLGHRLARRGRHLTGLAAAALLWMAACYALFMGIGRVNFLNETRNFASILRQERRGNEPVYAYQCYLRGLPFYLRETVGLVLPHSDDIRLGLESGHSPWTFPGEKAFLASLHGDTRMFVVVREEDLHALQVIAGRPLYILARSDQHDLVSNRLGDERGRELQALLGLAGVDLDAAIARAASMLPGSEVALIEIERLEGEPTCTLLVRRGGESSEISFPIAHPAEVTLEESLPASEETGAEVHLLRVAPPAGSPAEISRFLRAAAGL
jgi:4-amino-4-deoxy-L-arabinose transferase-like glycosyltransferase